MRIVSRSPGLSVITFERAPFEMHSRKLLLSRSFHSRSVCIIDIRVVFPLAVKSRDKITPHFPDAYLFRVKCDKV